MHAGNRPRHAVVVIVTTAVLLGGCATPGEATKASERAQRIATRLKAEMSIYVSQANADLSAFDYRARQMNAEAGDVRYWTELGARSDKQAIALLKSMRSGDKEVLADPLNVEGMFVSTLALTTPSAQPTELKFDLKTFDSISKNVAKIGDKKGKLESLEEVGKFAFKVFELLKEQDKPEEEAN